MGVCMMRGGGDGWQRRHTHSTPHQTNRHGEVLAELYREYGFLMQEEVREQLLSHLLSLTTVDIACFSANYPAASILYQITIVTAKCVLWRGYCVCGTPSYILFFFKCRGFRAGTTANVGINLIGTLAETGTITRPKGPCFASGAVDQFEFEHPNLGQPKVWMGRGRGGRLMTGLDSSC